MTKDQLLDALLLERYGPPPLPPAAPPHPVEQALADRAAPPPPVRRRHLVVLDGGATEPPRRDHPLAQHTIGALMEHSLDEEHVLLLAAVEQRRVHCDRRYTSGPDYEQDPAAPWLHKRATRRITPLKKARLVELDPDAEPDKNGVRPYKLTALGEQVLAEARAQETAAAAEPEQRSSTA